MHRRPLFAALAAVTFVVQGWAVADELADRTLIASLQKGGYVLYLRHPQTDPNQADTDPLNLDNVRAQRQLTPAGEAQARRLGEVVRALKLPLGRVIASKYQRARETARLAGFTAEISLDVSEPQNVPPVEGRRRAAVLRSLLSTPPAPGTNVLIVSHRPNLQDAAGKDFGDLGEGELVVFEPLGAEGFRTIARVSADTWSGWTAGKR